jgi:hypothetical protein
MIEDFLIQRENLPVLLFRQARCSGSRH